MTVALADHDNALPLAILIAAKATVAPMLAEIGWLDVAAEIRAIGFGNFASAANGAALHFGCHRLTHFVRQHEGGFVLGAEIAAKGQHALTLDLVAEDRDGREIRTQRHLVMREQRAGRDAVIGAAGFAAPAGRTMRAAAVVASGRAAGRAYGLALGIRPANLAESALGLGFGHLHDLGEDQSAGFRP